MLLKNNRRNFVKNAAIGTLAAIAIPDIITSAYATERSKKAVLEQNDVVLFQGDSITEWGRDKNKKTKKYHNEPSTMNYQLTKTTNFAACIFCLNPYYLSSTRRRYITL